MNIESTQARPMARCDAVPIMARATSKPKTPYSPKCSSLSSFPNSDAIAGAGPDESLKISAAKSSTGSQYRANAAPPAGASLSLSAACDGRRAEPLSAGARPSAGIRVQPAEEGVAKQREERAEEP